MASNWFRKRRSTQQEKTQPGSRPVARSPREKPSARLEQYHKLEPRLVLNATFEFAGTTLLMDDFTATQLNIYENGTNYRFDLDVGVWSPSGVISPGVSVLPGDNSILEVDKTVFDAGGTATGGIQVIDSFNGTGVNFNVVFGVTAAPNPGDAPADFSGLLGNFVFGGVTDGVGDVTQTAAVDLDVTNNNFVSFTATSVLLNNPANDFSAVGVFTVNDATLFDVDAITINGGNVGGALSVDSMGDINQIDPTDPTMTNSITVTGTTLFNAGAGDICLNDPNNDFQNTVDINSANEAEIVDANDLTIGTAVVDLHARFEAGASGTGELTLTNDITAGDANVVEGNRVLLQATDGVTQSGGTITSEQLLLSGQGDFVLNATNVISTDANDATNDVGSIAAQIDGSLDFVNNFGIFVDQLIYVMKDAAEADVTLNGINIEGSGTNTGNLTLATTISASFAELMSTVF